MNRTMLFLPILFFTGCASTTGPDIDLGFAELADLEAFEGCYKNCSDTSDGSASVCLSDIIWPKVFEIKNKPEAIFIEQEGNNGLMVSAISNGVTVKKSTFEAGKDFHFKNGRIELDREYIASGAGEPGNVFIGIGTGQTVLGLDEYGQGRVSQSVAFAGTGFLIIPVAGTATDVSKIERSESLCN